MSERRKSRSSASQLCAKRSIAAADKVCDHVFRFVGCPEHKLAEQILWNEDPFDYDQWAIALNRHSHWLTLGRVYTGTKDEKYAREWIAPMVATYTADRLIRSYELDPVVKGVVDEQPWMSGIELVESAPASAATRATPPTPCTTATEMPY